MLITIDQFMTVFLVGAAVLALWVVARWPGFGPSSLVASAAHVIAALVGGTILAGYTISALGSLPVPAKFELSVLVGALPICVYLCLTLAWFTRSIQRMLMPYR